MRIKNTTLLRLPATQLYFSILYYLLFPALFLLHTSVASAQSTASSIFDARENQVYQVRVIDVASGDKYSIGSGFRVSESGHLATNFHVVSSYVHEPEKYRLEYIAADKSEGPLELLAIDVVHDLAIVYSEQAAGAYMALADEELSKGDRIYSMGNPHDLGMTIVEGNYNGLVENSRYQKILFSGSLNGGMSGGPAFNVDGEVIGINVSKGGEQLSFLVPVRHLSTLMQANLPQAGSAEVEGTAQEEKDFDEVITRALLDDQQQFYQALLAEPLQEKQMGDLRIAEELHESLKCWGHTVDEEDNKYEAVHQHCRSEDEIYISNTLYLGDFDYDVELINTSELNRFQFYNFLEGRFEHRRFRNTRDAEDVSNFSCHSKLVALASGSWKISTCFRAYKRYSGLYDGSMIMVSMDFPDRAAVVKVAGSGVSVDNALAVFKRIMEAVAWTH